MLIYVSIDRKNPFYKQNIVAIEVLVEFVVTFELEPLIPEWDPYLLVLLKLPEVRVMLELRGTLVEELDLYRE